MELVILLHWGANSLLQHGPSGLGTDEHIAGPWDRVVLPRRVDFSLQSGTLHTLTSPVQLPVARSLLFGEKRTMETGRSSPIWEPMFWVVFT